MRIAVASGKGGAGKTTLATSLALLLSRSHSVHFLDCDVEAPNAALFLHPALGCGEEATRAVPVVDEAACDHCGECSAACRFHAIASTGKKILVFASNCHGCGGCSLVCPRGAISERPRPLGEIREGAAGAIRFTQATLKTGETATVHLIRAVKRRETSADVAIVDAPPGTSCAAVAAVEGASMVVLVTEPTPFGLNDLSLALEMTRQLGLRAAVVINRDGIGDGRIDSFCASAGVPVIGRIADDRRVAEVYSRGEIPALRLASFRQQVEEIAACLAPEVAACR